MHLNPVRPTRRRQFQHLFDSVAGAALLISLTTGGLANESASTGGLLERGNESTSTISGTCGGGFDSTPDEEDDCNINCSDEEEEEEEEKFGMLEEDSA